jgi:hypothetical protein
LAPGGIGTRPHEGLSQPPQYPERRHPPG